MRTTGSIVVSFMTRAVLLSALWWILAEGQTGSLSFGVPTVILAAAVSVRIAPDITWRLRPTRLLRFSVYFIAQSLKGGVDVAVRAIRPDMPLAPGTERFRLRLQEPAARILAADVLSLLPGTLTVRLEGRMLRVHALDCREGVEASVRRLEEEVGALFGENLRAEPGSGKGAEK